MAKKTQKNAAEPWGLRWRCSVWMITIVVGTCIFTDLIVYTALIPVIPYRLQELGYTDVASKTGYLLFAYSGGLVICEPHNSHHLCQERRMPLLAGIFVLMGSQVMFMEAPTYAVKCVARVLQGLRSAAVWAIGLALLCDTTPEERVGRQLGIALSGLSLGAVIGTPIGAALYTALGFRAPFIFGIGCCMLDLVGRLLLIERKEALSFGIDPTSPNKPTVEVSKIGTEGNTQTCEPIESPRSQGPGEGSTSLPGIEQLPLPSSQTPKHLSPLGVIIVLCRSPRALTVFMNTLTYGIVITLQEPTLPLHMQDAYNFSPFKVGLVYIAAAVPSLISGPLGGWLSDLCPLPLFVTCLALSYFFSSAVVAPLTSDLAGVSRSLDGIGYAHVFGSFNLAYSVGSAVGPLIGGQIYDYAANGWAAICALSASLLLLAMFGAFFFAGESPLGSRLDGHLGLRQRSNPGEHVPTGDP